MKKIFKFLIISLLIVSFNFSDYILFYGKWCPHCAKVEEYISSHNLANKIKQVEVYFSETGKNLFIKTLRQLNLNPLQTGVPFLYISHENKYIEGDKSIINFLKNHKIENYTDTNQWCSINQPCNEPTNEKNNQNVVKNYDIFHILRILILAAFTDSINPCALAVMAILLTTILLRYKSIKKVILTGLLFTTAVFISYYLMWLWLLKIISEHTSWKIWIYIKYLVGILWIIVWLANLKDAIRYWKLFVMEVPFSRRPYLKKIIWKVTSPIWWFFIWGIVSLFLLPCTAWPYVFFNGYLAMYNINTITKYLLLGLYNLIFVLPMIGITILVSFGITQPQTILEKKDKYIKLIHWIVGLILIFLGIYVLLY